MNRTWLIAGIPTVLLAIGLAVLGYYYHSTTTDLTATRTDLASTTQAYASTTLELLRTQSDNDSLSASLAAERAKNGTFEAQIAKISGTVGTLTKLSQTDPELLKKYSRVFFLSDNYTPANLANIDPEYIFEKGRVLQAQSDVKPRLEQMIDDAKKDGVDLSIISAYRSFGTQAALKSSYKVTYGAGSNAFSADQGYSEHQLGTAFDLTTPTIGATFVGFDKTSAYQWLTDNAWEYGFILSYPSGNSYYVYESWHWRFVGNDLARYLHNEHKNFYDLDQREIDPYLISIFD